MGALGMFVLGFVFLIFSTSHVTGPDEAEAERQKGVQMIVEAVESAYEVDVVSSNQLDEFHDDGKSFVAHALDGDPESAPKVSIRATDGVESLAPVLFDNESGTATIPGLPEARQ